MTEHEAIIKRAVEYFGAEHQKNMVIEECAELIQALQKKKRYGFTKMRERVQEEIVDVCICLGQFEIIYGIENSHYFVVSHNDGFEDETERLVVIYASKLINGIADGYRSEEIESYYKVLFWYVRVLSIKYFDRGSDFYDLYHKKLEALKNIMDNGIKEREI